MLTRAQFKKARPKGSWANYTRYVRTHGKKATRAKPARAPARAPRRNNGGGGLTIPIDPYLKPQKPKAIAAAWDNIASLYGPPDASYAPRDPDELAARAGDYAQAWAAPFADQLSSLIGSVGGGGSSSSRGGSSSGGAATVPYPSLPGPNFGKAFQDYLDSLGKDRTAEMQHDLGAIEAPQGQQDKLIGGIAAQTSSAKGLSAAQQDVIDTARQMARYNQQQAQQYAAAAVSGHVSGGGSTSDPFAKALAKVLSDGPNNAYKAFGQMISLEKTNAPLRLRERQGIAKLGSDFYNNTQNREQKSAVQRQNTYRDILKLGQTAKFKTISAAQAGARINESVRSHNISHIDRQAGLTMRGNQFGQTFGENVRHHGATEAASAASAAATARSKAASARSKAAASTARSRAKVVADAYTLAKALYGSGPSTGSSGSTSGPALPSGVTIDLGGGVTSSTKHHTQWGYAYVRVSKLLRNGVPHASQSWVRKKTEYALTKAGYVRPKRPKGSKKKYGGRQ